MQRFRIDATDPIIKVSRTEHVELFPVLDTESCQFAMELHWFDINPILIVWQMSCSGT